MQNDKNCLKLSTLKHGQMICTLFELEMPGHIVTGIDWH